MDRSVIYSRTQMQDEPIVLVRGTLLQIKMIPKRCL
jgi:hypothetical protein